MRRNIRMFWTANEAERRGYVACLRCCPNSLTPAEKAIKAILEYIEDHLDETVTLGTLSNVALLSPHHLQEVFKRIVGLSPKAFCDARRFARFKQNLRSGRSIAAACYEVGYGSSRALYERTSKNMGMTPFMYLRGGHGVRIQYSITRAVRDTVLIAWTRVGLCAVLPGKEVNALIRDLRNEFPKADIRHKSSARWKFAVRSCRVEDPLLCRLPLVLRMRIFQARVWNTIASSSA
jgi:AraC family transcriptional regulator, regulatory protein of adaptative response / methylated-DNA-[protein]-cysteine methyltransferase